MFTPVVSSNNFELFDKEIGRTVFDKNCGFFLGQSLRSLKELFQISSGRLSKSEVVKHFQRRNFCKLFATKIEDDFQIRLPFGRYTEISGKQIHGKL